MPEPDACRFECATRDGSAQSDPGTARRRQVGARGGGLSRRPLRRLRALSAAAQGEHARALGRPLCLRRWRFLSARSFPAPAPRAATAAHQRAARARGEAPRVIVFWLIPAALGTAALFVVLRPLVARRARAAPSRREANIA